MRCMDSSAAARQLVRSFVAAATGRGHDDEQGQEARDQKHAGAEADPGGNEFLEMENWKGHAAHCSRRNQATCRETLGVPGEGISPRMTRGRISRPGLPSFPSPLLSRRSAMVAALQRFFASNRCVSLLLIASIAVVAAGCGKKDQPAAAETPKFRPVDDSAPVQANFEERMASGERLATNDGNPLRNQNATPPGPGANRAAAATAKNGAPGDDLMAVLQQLDSMAQQPPRGNTEQAQIEDFVRIH